MRIRSVRRPAAAGLKRSLPPPALGKIGLLALLATGLLAGCAMEVPLPDSALLERLPAPSCEYRKTATGKDGAEDSEAVRTKLDYERQCYRHAAMIAQARLRNLQKSVSRTVLALRAERTAQARGLPQMVGP